MWVIWWEGGKVLMLSYGKQRALNELRSIFACQWSNGMLPQIRFVPESGESAATYRPGPDDWGVTADISGPTQLRTSGITQPPIMGLCAYEVFQKLSEGERAANAGEFLRLSDGLGRFHDWLLRERDPHGEHLVLCLHPWETGTDNSPAFDPLIEATRRQVEASGLPVSSFGRADTEHVPAEHRPTDRDYFAYFGLLALFRKHGYEQHAIIEESAFLLQDVLFNGLLAASILAHVQLQRELADLVPGESERASLKDGAERVLQQYGEVAAAIRSKLWHDEDGFFYSRDVRGDRLLRTATVAGFVPLLGGVARDGQVERLLGHLSDAKEFATEVPVPSTGVGEEAFNPVRYWSGPSWPVTNWLIIRGLEERGMAERAEGLRGSTMRIIEEGREPGEVRRAAEALMEGNSVGEEFTTPSRRQYQHGWLWDSAIVAASWPLVERKPVPLVEGAPGFWEYYHPATGEPLGAPHMTWTASLYLELRDIG